MNSNRKAISALKKIVGYIFSSKDLEKKTIDAWLDTPIYRIFPVSRFIQVLTSRRLALVKPKKWDDPFENALLSSEFLVDNETATISAKDSVYGQCWTLHRETDAMWRIYSQSKDGVRVRTTPKRLLEALKMQVGAEADIRCFIGKVQYMQKADLLVTFSRINLLNPDGSGIAESLLYKRREFSHEREVRLIYSGEDNKCQDDIFSFDIDPSELFDSILFDPRMEKSLRQSFITALTVLGCDVDVRRSSLYDPPEGLRFKL